MTLDFILPALWWIRIRGLWKLLDGRDWLQGKLGLILMDGAMFSKSWIQFSIDGWSCVPSLLFDIDIEVPQSCPTLCNPMDCSLPGSSVHEIFPGKNTGVGCHFLLWEIFPTQGLNLGLLHCRQSLYQLSHQGRRSNYTVIKINLKIKRNIPKWANHTKVSTLRS